MIINKDSQEFKELQNKLLNREWRIDNFYYIIDKNQKRIKFKRNRAQKHFDEHKTKRNIVLKSRQLGFTTFEAIDILDEVLFQSNFTGLFIAHTEKDAIEIFDKKFSYAWKNIDKDLQTLWKVNNDTANKLKFDFGNGDVSSVIVSNSGRSMTNNRVHISEFAKLCAKYNEKANEIITGTIPSVPLNGRIDIESTAEGMSGAFYEMYEDARNRKGDISQMDFTAFFYNWTWDDEELGKIEKIIPISQMDNGEEFNRYQELHKLSNREITYYYLKWRSLNKDWDKLHQEYPTTPEEAFVASGNTFFNKERLLYLLQKTPNIINCQVPEYLKTYILSKELEVYQTPKNSSMYVMGGDVAEGKLGDSSTLQIIDNKTLDIVAKFNSNRIRPDDFSTLIYNLGKWYNWAYTGIESNSGLWVLTELFEKHQYPNLYFREAIDDITHSVSKQLGFNTNGTTRKVALDNLLVYVNNYSNCWTKDFIKEALTFIRNDNGRPEASEGKHDDEIISMAITLMIRENAPSERNIISTEPLSREEALMRKLEARKNNQSSISQNNYI